MSIADFFILTALNGAKNLIGLLPNDITSVSFTTFQSNLATAQAIINNFVNKIAYFVDLALFLKLINGSIVFLIICISIQIIIRLKQFVIA
jgi:hypothetical protein